MTAPVRGPLKPVEGRAHHGVQVRALQVEMQGRIEDIPRLRLPATGVQTGVMTGGVLVQTAQEVQARHVHERHLLHVQDHTGQRRGQ